MTWQFEDHMHIIYDSHFGSSHKYDLNPLKTFML